MWTIIFGLGHVYCSIGVSVKNQNRIANSVDPNETAHYHGTTLFEKKKTCFSLQG